jgi:capsular polysaccharide biosynthesis protein
MENTYKLTLPRNGIKNEFGPYEFKEVSVPSVKFSKRNWVVLDIYMLNLGAPLRGLFKLINALRKGDKLTYLNEAVFVCNEHSLNYFHWLNDMLPKLEYVSNFLSNHIVILPEYFKTKEYVSQTLLSFKLKIHFIKDNEIILVKKIIDLDNLNGSGAQNPEFLMPAINKIKALYSENSVLKKTNSKIFITRRNEENRRTLPLNEIEIYLAKKGYLIVEAEKLNFREQIKLFSQCTHLIAVHGAGLTNMLFMPKAQNILEIKSRGDYKNYCYYFMSNVMEHNYFYFLGQNTNSKNRPIQEVDLIIDLKLFNETLSLFESNNKIDYVVK